MAAVRLTRNDYRHSAVCTLEFCTHYTDAIPALGSRGKVAKNSFCKTLNTKKKKCRIFPTVQSLFIRGLAGGGSVVGSPYQSHPSDLQISPRNSEEYAAMQQAQANLQSHGQHLHLRSQQHLLHTPPIHGYGSRRATGEMSQGNAHSGGGGAGGGNSYRKDSVDYYFSVSGRERSRRGGAAYGTGFRYANVDGHAPHQYQHLPGSGSSSGMITPYSLDYGSSSGSAVGGSNSSGAGSFSPSQQYSMAHTASVQSGAQMHQRQHGQKFPAHQGLQQGQHHRTYPLSGNRIPPQFGHFAPLSATSGSTGMYSSPPQRYDVSSSSSTDAKTNNSPTRSNPNTHTISSVSNSCENMGQNYSSSAHPPYSPQSQSLHKHAPHSQRTSQHSTGAGYEPSLKMQHQGHLHTKLPHSSVSSSPALPSHPSQDLAKSPMHSQSQQAHIHQNFSPISNPSPAPSAVQSPSCSSSSSPLMGSSEGNSAATHLQPASHPSVPNVRGSQSHGRLLQAVPQLSPTPNSNSSISSCGSGVGTKTAVLNHSAGIGHAAISQNRMGLGLRGGPGEDGSLYPHDKLLQDPGLNSLNALTSQVENLPNTVQHMLLTDTVLPQKKSRDSAHHLQILQGSGNQNKSGNFSTSGQTSVNEESSEMLETTGHPQVECRRIRQASGTSNESEPQSYPSSQSQMASEPSQQGSDLQVNTGVISTASKQPSTRESQSKTPETLTPSSSSPPSVHPSAEPSPKQPAYPPAPPSPIHSARPNCVAEKDLCNDEGSGTKGRKIKTIKDEDSEGENAGPSCERENSKNRLSAPPTKDEAETDAQQTENVNVSEQHNVGGVGVIVSARSEVNTESSKHTGAKSTRYGISHYSSKHGNPENQRDVNVLRETRNHNGEGEVCMETYVSQYDISPKQEFGQNSQPSVQTHPASLKYSNPEIHYNAAKSKGKLGLGSSMGTNRCQNYHQLQASYGSIGRKEIGVFAVEAGRGIVSRSQDSGSQFHQSFPSLLQEVLQGHHLDRRYGRPDQTSSVHQQPQDTSQHRYQTRLPYSMVENLSSHAMSSQTLLSGLNVKFNQMVSGKPPNSSQNQGPENDVVLGPPHPSWDSEAHKSNVTHGISLEKSKTSLSPSQSSHMQQSLDLTTGAPSKHINLADYTLQHRKPSRYGTSPSAVEQLLLQEAEPLACGVGPISHTPSQTSSGRRSVICDVSPSRRTTPERERGHSGTSGPSVIQQPFSSSGSNEQECGKEETKAKKAQNKEDSSKTEAAGQNTEGYCGTPPSKESSKPLPPPVDVDSDIEKTSSAKGNSEATSNLPYLLQMSSNPLSSPPRHQSFSQAVDGFRAYGFSDTMDGPKMISHPTPHQAFHTVSAYSKTTPSTNKLQVFPQSLPPHERPDWTPDRQRPRGMDRHVPQRLSEQKCKSQSSSDSLPGQHHVSRQHSYPGSHFDMKIWDTYPEREGAGQPTAPPHEHVGSQPVTNAAPKLGEEDISDKSAEDTAKSFHSLAPVGAISPAGHTGKTTQGIQQGQRGAKTGTSAETNPLIMRRRVRSFISPIPAKRQHQDVPGQRPGSAYHSPLSHSDSRLAANNCSGSTDTQSKLPSPKTQHSISSANSPSQSKAKFLPPRKGHGLKLEAIVRKITPGVKKNDFNNSHVESDFSEVSHYTSDMPDAEGGTSFSSVPQGEEACLSYLDDSHTLDDLMPYRAVEDAFSCDSQTLKPGATASSTGALRSLPKDFDFGLGAGGSSGSLGENDKDDFTLLGPLPPAPPLPCPVQGSPPPSSSALSDIQQFTNTYQQLETRRGEQSAANLLRQKLQETGMGFDDYPGGDYYGATTGHSQSPGHHLLSRAPQHQMTSLRLTSSEPKPSEHVVPKGYFPSGKKKGRPVGSVNKQKRAQAQIQNAATNIPAASLPSPTAIPQSVPIPNTASEVPQASTPPDQKPCPPLVPPAETQVVKVDVESEETQPELDVKPPRHRQKKGKEGSETPGNQRRRRRGMVPKEKLDTQASSRGNVSLCGIFSDARNNVFAPYIHVEKKIAEIGAICTIINAEDEKSKGGGKAGHLGVDGPLNTPLSSQLVRKEKENERTKENWASEPVDSALQSGKTLPTSGYVLQGPVISETGHTGRLLCCLCQKWANYKHLGDLYGPFYPAEYAAKLPKNPPQVRQASSYHGAATTGFSMTSIPTEATPQDTRLQDPQIVKSSTDSDCTVSQATNPTSPATTIGTVSPSMGEEMPFQTAKASSSTSKVTSHSWDPAAELTSGLGTVQELDGEVVLQQLHVENTQQRPQHRKLTSHPRFKRRHKSSEDLPRTVPINSKASLPFQPPPPSQDSLGPMAQMAQLPLVPLDPEELWVHEGCIVWTSGIYLVNGRLYGLQEALDGARDTSCSHCEMVGSTLGCYSKGCTLRYHYLCAIEADCSLNEDNFSLRCPKHKVREQDFHLVWVFGRHLYFSRSLRVYRIRHKTVAATKTAPDEQSPFFGATELPSLERRTWSSRREDERTLDKSRTDQTEIATDCARFSPSGTPSRFRMEFPR
ncbi:Transcription factor 20 [Labeo rohita]|uniref:Transcription factor 20 n=1 Tax=Labeo rohita TaxID=84645 RepID=A0ABQ8MVH9_LABRO|nr:Transcription factor 20 [Labeo rohita]